MTRKMMTTVRSHKDSKIPAGVAVAEVSDDGRPNDENDHKNGQEETTLSVIDPEIALDLRQNPCKPAYIGSNGV